MRGAIRQFEPAIGTAIGLRSTAALRSTVIAAGFGAALDLALSAWLPIPVAAWDARLLLSAGIFSAFLLFSFPSVRILRLAGPRAGKAIGLAMLAAGPVLLLWKDGSLPFRLPAAWLTMTSGTALFHVSANFWVSRSQDSAEGFFWAGAATGPWLSGLLPMGKAPADGVPSAPYWVAAAAFGFAAIAAWQIGGAERAEPRLVDRMTGAIFCGIGAELGIMCLLVSFCVRPEIGHLAADGAAAYVVLYWSAIAAGRVAGVGLLTVLPPQNIIGGGAVAACLLATAAVGSSGRLALSGLILAGTAVSTLLPSVHALGVPSTALLAALAGTFVPLFEGVLAIRIGVQGALVVPAVCCLYLVLYGFARLEPWAGRIARPERRTSVCSIRTPRRSS